MDTQAKAHAFVRDLDAPELDDDDRHHWVRVLRLRAGDTITVSDGHGGWRRCRFGDELEPMTAIQHDAPGEPEIAIAIALVKGERTEWTVQKLCELGVDRIVPFVADRAVVRWDDSKAAHHHDRLTKIARSAAMQCRRARLPDIEPLRSFADVSARPGLALAALGGAAPTLSTPLVAIGPEGGWSEAERGQAPHLVSLGPSVLRADTAAVAACSLLVALRAGLVVQSAASARMIERRAGCA